MILGKRRFRVLSPTLVRIEYSPDGVFEDRRSMVAYAEQVPLNFLQVGQEGGWDVLDTGAMQIRTRANDEPPDRLNFEIRWSDGEFMQVWRPGDRDYQNLGGTLRSLDRYSGEACALDGVHPATMEPADSVCSTWVAWNQDEVEPLYGPLHPSPPNPRPNGSWLNDARHERSEGRFPARTFNIYKEARKFAPGLLSASGYYVLNDSLGAVLDLEDFPIERKRPGSLDWYFFAYGKNFKRALSDFRLLSGAAPLLPRKSLGILFSRWPAFSQPEIEDLAGSFRSNGYPLSTLVMDMEWHKEGWGHWEFDPALIPDPALFFARCRELGLDVTFNDHPLDVREDDRHFEAYVQAAGPDVQIREREYKGRTVRMAAVDICNRQQNRAFRQICQAAIWDLGLDYWWNDGSRGQMQGTLGQLVSNKSFYEDSVRMGRRGMHLARHGGFGSHRYGAFFTGDANSDFHVLRLQCEFNIRAAGAGISHISHDIGGFAVDASQVRENARGTAIIDPERYLRWLQFGVFNPILRFHSAPGSGSRRPDDYDDELNGACRHWLRVRHSLMPYLYSAVREFHETGIPVTRGLYLEDPTNPEAYRFDEFFFGPDLLVAPMLSADRERVIYLPPSEGGWWEFESASHLPGGQTFTRSVELKDMPVYVRAGSLLPRQDPDGELHPSHLKDLILDVYPGAKGRATLYEDDGVSESYLRGTFCQTEFSIDQDGPKLRISGRVVSGHPIRPNRSIILHLSLLQAPQEVRDDQGEPLPVEPLPVYGRFQVRLPERKTAEAWSVEVVTG
jgi:hypothetical protein